MPIITLLTDFGTQDYFVGAMKGVILSINPRANIVDITHDIPPQDVQGGAFNLLASYRDFPRDTVHVAVVDPGVGSSRRPIIVECANQLFVGPDNGLLSWVCQKEGSFRAWHLTNEKFFRHPVSATFHGRDVFAPVAAALSNGARPEEFGPAVDEIVQLQSLNVRAQEAAVEGAIIHVDRFGNCITNLTVDHLPGAQGDRKIKISLNGREITSFRRFFADNAERNSELFAIVGSAGFIEIAVHNSSAAAVLKAERGQQVVLIID
jgi:S-adenosylmethionine hydrolase